MSPEFLTYVVSRFLLQGALLAVEIAAVAIVLGLALGLCLALMRMSHHRWLSAPAWCYIWFIRGTPLLLQLVFIYDVLPGIGIRLDTFSTAVIGFALNEAAFSAESLRGGILAGNRSQGIGGAGHVGAADLAAHHLAASHARNLARHGEPGDQHVEEHVDRLDHLRQRID